MAVSSNKRFLSDDEKSIHEIRERFLKINDDRLNSVRDALSVKQRQFLDIIPLLFHMNDAQLPGYVGENCPTGIYDFLASKESTDVAKKLVKNYTERRTPLREYHIYALYLIGSAGTIAYTDKSDLDIWVCHRSDLSDDDIYALQSKCEKLTEWAASLNLEANFFVLTPESIREGQIETMSEESSGSAQHLLLIEEFYRSGLLLSGRIPAWWLVPPEHENKYYLYLEKLLNKKIISEHDIIDFGDVTTIPAAEFYGAALWQLNKSIGSPYKSILKLLLMESYASEYPNTELLCTRLKREIYDGETDINKLDSYVLMIDKLDQYLSKQESVNRLNLARRCFYFKVHEWLTNNRQQSKSRSHEIMSELTQRWNWSRDDLILLDSRETWKIDRVIEERNILVNELTYSYRLLTDLARQHTQETNISQEDLNILGRRLYSAFERKAGKIELINPGISINVSERKLTFVCSIIDETATWLLYRNEYPAPKSKNQAPIKRSQNLIELVAWSYFNGILGDNTLSSLQSSVAGVTSQDLLELIDAFKTNFPNAKVEKATVKQLSEPATITASALVVNLGIDPLSTHTRNGMHLTSNRSDALSFGGKWQNLIQTCSSVVVTSWGEIITAQYGGNYALLDCLTDFLSWSPLSSTVTPSDVTTLCFSTSYGASIARRVSQLFDDLSLYFYKSKWKASSRYILRVARQYTILQIENDVLRYDVIGNEDDLMKALGAPQKTFSPYLFDRHSNDNASLKLLQRYNKPDVIQLFYYDHKGSADIYVLDENGSLYFQTINYFDIPTMLGHYKNFFEAAIKRRHMHLNNQVTEQSVHAYEMFEIKQPINDSLYVDLKSKPATSERHNYFNIQVIGDIFSLNQDTFYLYCDGKEFSNLEHGKRVLVEAVNYILSKRKQRERYPIYITDIDANQSSSIQERYVQTVQLLNYKKHIELKLNKTLKTL